MRDVVLNAITIAFQAHQGQQRKWGEPLPYVVHPARVAARVTALPGTNAVDVSAAWLHDVLEDCGEGWAAVIEQQCGPEVLELVRELTYPTDTPAWDGVPRAEKNVIRFAHTEEMSNRARRIKMVDRWDNLLDMKNAPVKLIRKYLPESRRLLQILRPADPDLAAELEQALDQLEASLSDDRETACEP